MCFSMSANAGMMSDQLDVQLYRDFAENRGIFSSGATNVDVYDKSGKWVGTIKRMMNFDGVADAHTGEAALVGGPGFIATVAHDYNNEVITFAKRFGAVSGTAFYDSYRTVSVDSAWGDEVNYTYDYRVQRLSKIVTEATSSAYLTDKKYLENITGRDCVRVGSGTQKIATANGVATTIAGGYAYLTGGTLQFDGWAKAAGIGSVEVGNAYTYDAYRFWYNYRRPNAKSPLNIGVTSGDSGSPTYFYNEDTQAWEWVGAGQSGGGDGYDAFSQMRSGNFWAVDLIASYDLLISSSVNGGDILLGTTNSEGRGTISQGGSSVTFTGLASGLRGDTSTSGTLASNAALDACHNLVWGGAGGTLVLQGSLDTGAGSFTFNGNYLLTDGGNASRRLNSAGFVINRGAVVTTELTGTAGDEWRKIGEGTFIISGMGTNEADLNVGGNGLVVLQRSGGTAVRNVKLNGGEVIVRLKDNYQIAGDIIFGHRGGIVDLNGNDRTASKITHLDEGAVFANLKENSVSVFEFAGKGAMQYQGRFLDGGSLEKGRLDVVYNPGDQSSVWTLSGIVENSGAWQVKGGTLVVAGSLTKHAGGYVDKEDWMDAAFLSGAVSVSSGAGFVTGGHALVTSDIAIAQNAAFEINGAARQTGEVSLQGSSSSYKAAVASGTAVQDGRVTGQGTLLKTGSGDLLLNNGLNDFSGQKRVDEGRVLAASLAALGTGTANWMVGEKGVLAVKGAESADVLARLSAASSGVYALMEDKATVSLNGYSSLFLGAVDKVALGQEGTLNLLGGWNGDGGWNLGGGGGELTMHLKLSGTGTLYIGNGFGTGSVMLTNIHNSDTQGGAAFTGKIVVSDGVMLGYTDIRALGMSANNILVNYGNSFSLGSDVQAVLGHLDKSSEGVFNFTSDYSGDLDMAGMGFHSAYLGAETAARLSGNITAGAGGYRFGGFGTLTVSSDLGGTHSLTLDPQGISAAGTLILTGNNTYSGTTTISGGAELQIGSGGTAGSLGQGSVVNNGVLCYNRSNDGTFAQNISGTGNLIKKGVGTLVLKDASYSGSTTIDSGSLCFGDGGVAGLVQTSGITNKGVLKFNHSNGLTVGGVISGTGSLIKDGEGKLTLMTAATYTGGTEVRGGILQVGKTGGGSSGMLRGKLIIGAAGQVNLTSGDSLGYNGDSSCVTEINIQGGTLYLADTNNQTFQNTRFELTAGKIDGVANGRLDVWNNAVFNVRAAVDSSIISGLTVRLRDAASTVFNVENGGAEADLIVSAAIVNSSEGSASFTKSGTGTMVLTGTNTHTGTTSISLGVLRIGNGGTSGTLGRGNVVNDSVLEINRSNDYAISNVISGSGRLLITGGGMITLTGANTYGGTTMIENGVLCVGSGGTSGALGSGNVVNNARLKFYRSDDIILGQAVSGSGQLVKAGDGGLTLNGNNSYLGGTLLEKGTLTAGHVSSFGKGAVTVSAGTLDAGGLALDNAVEIRGNAFLKGAAAMKGGLTVTSGVLTLSGATKAGTVTLSSGLITGGSLNGGSYEVFSGTMESVLGGAGNLTKKGAGKVVLSAVNTYSGATLVEAGELEVSGSLSATAVTVGNGGILNVSGVVAGNIVLQEGALLKTNAVSGMTLSLGQTLQAGHAAGTGKDIVGHLTAGTGSSLDIRGTLALQGNLALSGGKVSLASGSLLAVDGVLSVNAPTQLDLNGFAKGNEYQLASFSSFLGDRTGFFINRDFVEETRVVYELDWRTAGLYLNVTGDALDLTWSGGDGVWKTRGGKEWLLADGIMADKRFYAEDRVTFSSSGRVTVEGDVAPGSVLVTGNSVVTLDGNGRIVGNAGVTMQGTGVLTLNAVNGYEGNTLISSGSVVAQGNRSFGAGDILLKGGTLDLAGYAPGNKVLADGGILTRAENFGGELILRSGNLTLSEGTHSGLFTLSGGTMQGGSLEGSRFEVLLGTVSSVLKGSGTLTKSGSGEVLLSGKNTYSGRTLVRQGTLTLNAGGSLASAVEVESGAVLFWYGTIEKDVLMQSGSSLHTSSAGVTLTANQRLTAGHVSVNGTDVYGSLTTAGGSLLDVAGARTGTLALNGNLVLGGGSVLFTGTTSSLDRVDIGGRLDVTGLTLLDIDVSLGNGTYTLFHFGTAGDLSRLSIKDKGIRSSYALSSSGSEVLLTVDYKSLDIVWDGRPVWAPGSEEAEFHNGDRMIFDRGGNVALPGDVEPVQVVVSGMDNLAISGEGAIRGGGSLLKKGAGTLTLDLSNVYTGGTVLEGGFIKLVRDNGLGRGDILMTGDAGTKGLIFEKSGGGSLTQSGDIVNRGDDSSLASAAGTVTELSGGIRNEGALTMEGRWNVAGGLELGENSRTVLSSGAGVKVEQMIRVGAGTSLTLEKGRDQEAGATVLEGSVDVLAGGTVVLNENTALRGNTVIGRDGKVWVRGNTAGGDHMDLVEGGLLQMDAHSILNADVSVWDKAALTMREGTGVNGCLEVRGSGQVKVEGGTARTGLLLLTGANQLRISEGARYNGDLYLGTGSSHVMDQGQHLGGNLLADAGSILYVNDFVRLDGDYTVTNLWRGAEGHTLYVNMTEAMLGTTTDRPLFSMGGTLTAEGAFLITLDMRQTPDWKNRLSYCLFSPDMDAVSRESIEKAQVKLVDENGWLASVTDNVFDRLSGRNPGGDLVWRAPKGIGEIGLNSLWSTTQSMQMFAGVVRDHQVSAFVDREGKQNVWVSALTGLFNLSDDGNHPGYEYTTSGYALGTDFRVNSCWTLGAAFGQAFGKNRMNDGMGRFDQDMLTAGLYSDINFCHDDGTPGEFALNLWLGYGNSANDGNVVSPDLGNDTFQGSWDDTSLMFDIRGVWTKHLSDLTQISLFAGVQYVNTEQSDFTLTGDRNSYAYRDGSMSVLRMPVGVRVEHFIPMGDVQGMTLHASTGVTPDVMRNDPEASVQAVNRMWTAEGASPGKVSFNVNAGASFRMNGNWSVSAGYGFETSSGFNNHSGRVGATYSF